MLEYYPEVAAYLQNIKKIDISEKLRAEAMEKLTRWYWDEEQ